MKLNEVGNRGWFEPRKDVVTDKGVQKKAPRHYEISRKKGCCNTMTHPIPAPEKPKEVIFKFEKNIETDKDFDKLMFEFFKENPSAEYETGKNKLTINQKYVGALSDFLKKNKIDFYCDVIDEIIEEVQEGRKPQAIAIDNSKTAKKVGGKDDAEDLVEWVKEPGESDIRYVDTKK